MARRKSFEERANDLKAQKRDCDENIKRLRAEIAARGRDGAMPSEVARRKLQKLLGQQKVILSKMAELKNKQDSHGKYVLGGILRRHIQDHPAEPFLPEKILEALMADHGAARNPDLIGFALLLHRNVHPGASLDEFNKWASSPKDYLWIQPRKESKKQEPQSATPTPEPLTPTEPQPNAPVAPEDPIERARKDPEYRQEFMERLKEEWSKTFAINEGVLSRQLTYWQWEMNKETEMFNHTMKCLDAEEAKLREELKMQKGVFKRARKERIEREIREVDSHRGLCVRAQHRNLGSFKEKSSPQSILQMVFSDTKGQRPELFDQMSALGIAPG